MDSHFDLQVLEERTQAIGRELFELARREHAHLTTLNRWTKQVMAWCLSDRRLKAQVLRFLDCLPSLRTPHAVVRHLQDAFPAGQLRLPPALRLGVSLSRPGLLTAPAVALVVRQSVEHIARQFIAGAGVEDALQVGSRFAAQGLMTSFDILGERVVSEPEAQRYAERYAALITALSEWRSDAVSSDSATASRPTAHVSIKPSGLTDHFDPLRFEESVERVLRRLLPLAELANRAETASHRPVGITLDMEQYETRDVTLEVAKQLLLHKDWGDRFQLGIVIQAYLRDSHEVVAALLDWLGRHRRRLSIRLVKGAYWDSEVAYAAQRGWDVPVYRDKWETDAEFERLATKLLSASSVVRTEIASHNLRSIAHAMAVAEALDVPKARLEFQLLYGMGDAIQGAVAKLGYPVRIYTPVGELIPGMAYLVRRILENTANESFLRQDLWEEASPDDLLRSPSGESTGAVSVSGPSEGWPSEPLANFTNRRERERMSHALEAVQRDLGRDYPLLIGGEEVLTGQWIRSLNPAHPTQCIGRVAQAGLEELEQAVQRAEQAQRPWGRTPVVERAAALRRAAQLIRARRSMLAALEVLEVGKPWREADADVIEAIDYLEYYGEQMLRLSDGSPVAQRPGEANRYLYTPRGVCVVIAPWNFPLAILTGMASAALAAGNVVILKPAEQSPVIASHLTRILRDAGVPAGAVQYLPGQGEEIGRALVSHPAVRVIMFTGSKAVGLSIVQQAAMVPPDQRFVKQVVVEMGGKNAIIVDDDADLDAAIHGVLVSAFGYQGQKCSAASRLIVHDAVFQPLIKRLIGAVDGLAVRDPASPSADMGPLIDEDASRRVTTAIARGAESAKLLYRCPADRLPAEGYFVGPALFADVDPHSPLAQEELFGPVVCCFRVRSFDEALTMANETEYGLTGGVYSRSPSHLRLAIERFDVGNLYLNRPITGAMVGRQPFGGAKLSGLGAKAGGPDYLRHLLLPKTISDNTTRHGVPLE